MNRKKISVFYRLGVLLPCLFELYIFQCFRFADWKDVLSSEIQFRILCGSMAIAIFFALFYIVLFVWVKKIYTGEDKTKQLLIISLFGVLGFMSYIVGYLL